MTNLMIRILDPRDSKIVSEMLLSNSIEYRKYFNPFSFQENNLRDLLSNVKSDRYWGVWKDEELVGFFMLRGFDAGYSIPSYGVCVSEKYKGNGILKLSLSFVLTWCKINSIKQLMLKVHADNHVAMNVYEKYGFKQTGVDEKNNNKIYHYQII